MTYDITSAHYSYIEDGQIAFGMKNIPHTPRATLDEHARLLSDIALDTP